jgi:iron-sulfur cluster assembly accessory protein
MAMTEQKTTETTDTIGITASAADKVRDLLDREISAAPEEHEGKAYSLRVAVQPGGCAGLRYALYFDDRQLDDDIVSKVHGVEIRTDKMSGPYLRGAEIDYLDTLEQSGFTINNPNAKGTCACGDSAQF